MRPLFIVLHEVEYWPTLENGGVLHLQEKQARKRKNSKEVILSNNRWQWAFFCPASSETITIACPDMSN
jgi:hypothetical protein